MCESAGFRDLFYNPFTGLEVPSKDPPKACIGPRVALKAAKGPHRIGGLHKTLGAHSTLIGPIL